MGFGTIIATIISITLLIFVGYSFISGNIHFAEVVGGSYKNSADRTVELVNTDIKIINATYNESDQKIISYFENTGSVKFDGFNCFDALYYGETDNGEKVVEYLNDSSYTICDELVNPGIFDAQELSKLEANPSSGVENGTYVLIVCTPNAICNSLNFSVG